MKTRLFLLGGALFFLTTLSCGTVPREKAPEIYEIDGSGSFGKAYVIANPPKDLAELVRVVDTFFRASITVEDIEEKLVYASFYRETQFLNRNYEYGKPSSWKAWLFYGHGETQSLYNHNEVMAMSCGGFSKTKRFWYDYTLYTKRDFSKAAVSPDAWYYGKRTFSQQVSLGYFPGNGSVTTDIGEPQWEGEIRFDTKEDLLIFLCSAAPGASK